MALFAYRQQVERLLQDTQQVLYNLADIDVYINDARVQIALAAECIRQPAQIAMVQGQQSYAFSSATFTAAPTIPAGLGGVGNVRSCMLVLATTNPQGQPGQKRIPIRAWEWFESYYLAVNVPTQGAPVISARLQPGLVGTLWFAPPPDAAYQINLDAVAYPAALATDADPEALPYPWTDAVPFFAAYLAYLSTQNADAAQKMWIEYSKFQQRGTQITTPTRTPYKYPGGMGAQEAMQKVPLTGGLQRQGGG